MRVDKINSKATMNQPILQIEKKKQNDIVSDLLGSSRRARFRQLRNQYNPHLKFSPVIEIHNQAEFEKEIKNSSIPVVVDFYASWCRPCQQIAPLYETLSRTYEGEVKFLKINVSHCADLVDRYKITSIPTFLFFDKKGCLVQKMAEGNAAELRKNLENLVCLAGFSQEV